MAQFVTDAADYQRYGLDDPRCSVERPVGRVVLTVLPTGWHVETEAGDRTFARPLIVRKLHDRFELQFDNLMPLPGLLLLVPFEALSSEEEAFLNERVVQRHPANVPGDFYANAGECLCFAACTPAEIAPELVGYQECPEGCYFTRQPETEEEVDRAIDAMLSAFVDQLRYGGDDTRILARIRAATRDMSFQSCQGDLCDHPTQRPPSGTDRPRG